MPPITATTPRTVRQQPVHHHTQHPAAKTTGGKTHHTTGHSKADTFSSGTSRGTPSAARTNAVLDRLDPAHNPRYQPTGRRGTSSRVTHCNEFAQAALRQMGVPTPSGNANSMNRYFNSAQGRQQGWHAVSAAEAQRMANGGHAVVASWNNTRGVHGHIAVVRPGELGAGGPRIAQAGGHNFNNGSVRQGFGSHTPQYFVHD